MTTQPVLYIEDEEDYRILVDRILSAENIPVHSVETGSEGLDWLSRNRPSLIILDINLPDTNGYELCTQLRKQAAYMDLPILMLTVRRRPEEWLQGFSCGADDYLAKPINPPELLERVKTCVSGRIHEEEPTESSAEYQLIQAACSGNRSAFEVLIRQYREKLTDQLASYAQNRNELEEIVTNAFFRAFEKLNQFRGESSFYTWLYRIAVNESHHLRRNYTDAVSLDELTNGEETSLPLALTKSDASEQELADDNELSEMNRTLRFIPHPYRAILEDHLLRGFSYQSLSKKFQIPLGTVMSRLHKARQLFQSAWQERASS